MDTTKLNQPCANPSLKEVQIKFEQWRSSRSKKGRIPDYLWQQALALLKTHSRGEVSQALKLCGGQLKTKMQTLQFPQPAVDSPSDFISVNIPQAIEEIEFSGNIEIKRPDGATISIEGLNQRALSQILTQFTRGL